jgi:myo-inositol-1-phosphate synthase
MGVEAMRLGQITGTGMVTELPMFEGLGLVDPRGFVFGGYDIRKGDLYGSACEFGRNNGLFTHQLLQVVKERLLEITAEIRPGLTKGCGAAITRLANIPLAKNKLGFDEAVSSIKEDLSEFKARHNLECVIVVNLASSEPETLLPQDLEISRVKERLPASILYAYAAIDSGCPYINFTSSLGSNLAELDRLALQRGIGHMGRDGKTGETLIKSALAPLFRMRNLKVLSWESHNILGNRDGMILDSPGHKSAKIRDKQEVLHKMLPGHLHSHVSIDYVPSLGDSKVAWDFIHFAGFFGVRMSLQFIWQGLDSILAAPLVIDLVRLAELSHRYRQGGAMRHLAFFFKNPYGVTDQDIFTQFGYLSSYIESHRSCSPH